MPPSLESCYGYCGDIRKIIYKIQNQILYLVI